MGKARYILTFALWLGLGGVAYGQPSNPGRGIPFLTPRDALFKPFIWTPNATGGYDPPAPPAKRAIKQKIKFDWNGSASLLGSYTMSWMGGSGGSVDLKVFKRDGKTPIPEGVQNTNDRLWGGDATGAEWWAEAFAKTAPTVQGKPVPKVAWVVIISVRKSGNVPAIKDARVRGDNLRQPPPPPPPPPPRPGGNTNQLTCMNVPLSRIFVRTGRDPSSPLLPPPGPPKNPPSGPYKLRMSLRLKKRLPTPPKPRP